MQIREHVSQTLKQKRCCFGAGKERKFSDLHYGKHQQQPTEYSSDYGAGADRAASG
jgi:hypothetical protein